MQVDKLPTVATIQASTSQTADVDKSDNNLVKVQQDDINQVSFL